jgi:hypothetical protein
MEHDMTSKRPDRRAQQRSLCAHLHPDDGPPARRREQRPDPGDIDRKTRQLCGQIRRALHGIIPDPIDPIFEGVRVEHVEPAPDATRVRVTLSLRPRSPAHVARLRARLHALRGAARTHVAGQINRKRAPFLIFDLIPREDRR